ncbi:MAG: type II toxin-antitoxin system VapC family toxin [Pyrinomonadaceae bacterium]
MNAFYLDSSSIVKRFSREAGTVWVLKLFRPSNANLIYTARITSVEVVSGLMRKSRAGNLSSIELDKAVSRFERSLRGRYVFIDVNEPLLTRARNLIKNYKLRGYDAVQFAAALQIRQRRIFLNLSPIIFVSADNDLNAAATAEGLAVENPNNYP